MKLFKSSESLACAISRRAFLVESAVLASACSGGGGESIAPDGPPAAMTGANWMSFMQVTIGNRRLTDIVIPGTHDSGTYGITSSSPIANDGKGIDSINAWVADKKNNTWYGPILDSFGVFDKIMAEAAVVTSWWAKVQQNNFAAQLQYGVRYFDLRVQQWDATSFYCVHSLRGADFAELLAAVKTFYAQAGSGSEVLILDIQHTFQMNHETFVTVLKQTLVDASGNSLLIPRGSNLNLQSIWTTKQRILVFYDDDATVTKHPELWHSSSSASAPQIHSPWPNTHDSTFLYNFLGGQLDDVTDLNRKGGEFVVMQSLATEGFVNVALSIEAHLFNLMTDIAIIGKILKRLGFDHVAPMNFFQFNFGGTDLTSWLNSKSQRNQAAHRANILIIDDYSNFNYSKSDGTQGGYLDLIYELNTSRAAPSPQGPYHAVLKSQTANFTANHYQTYPVEFHFINTGQVAWDPAVVHLGTARPYDRTTHLYTNDGSWQSQFRILMQNTTAVQPGQEAVFKFNVTPDDYYSSSFQSFELVADAAYQGFPAQHFGDYYGNAAIYIQTDVLRYASALKSHSGNTTIAQFDTTTLTATFTNTGNMPWFPDVVFLGIPYPYWFATYYTPKGNWETNHLIRMQNTAAVMPGQDAIFSFGATANIEASGGGGAFPFQLVATKAAGLMPPQSFGSQGNVGISIDINYVQTPGNLAAVLVSKSPDCTIQRGQSAQLSFVFKNTGKISWYPDLMLLATLDGNASPMYTSTDGSWFEDNKIPMQNTAPVGPGESASFVFTATPNGSAVTGNQSFELNITYPFVDVWTCGAGGQGTIHVTVTG